MISINSESIPKRRIPLSVTPYGSGNTPDMIETPLQSMINNQLWKSVLILCIPWNSSLIHKNRIPFPLSCDTRSLSEVRSPIYLYHVHPHYRQVCLLVLMTLHPPWPSHTLASFIDATVTEWAQSINPSHGWKNPALGAHASTYLISVPKNIFSVIRLMTVDAIKAASRCND
jgi:hypothetical protein